jgi:hypothetical protein
MRYVLIFAIWITAYAVSAQDKPKKPEHDHHDHNHDHEHDKPVEKPGQSMPADTMHLEEHDHNHDEGDMHSLFSPNVPMNRDASGTSWQPDATPMFMHMWMRGKTMYMLHGSAFLRFNVQDFTGVTANRGGSKFDLPNMIMFAAAREISMKDKVALLTMFSLDPLTVGASGYPLLFQTGESYKGLPLVDRQHPHDFFAELALNYTHSFTRNVDASLYVGYPGEPAIGPPTFMHRLSGSFNPDAPLGHHWQDATHITFGVATAGIRYRNVKLEGSVFTGREPDENRWNFEKPRFDSYSFRLFANPHKNLSVQISQAFIESPEALEPEQDIARTTASATHTMVFNTDNYVSTTFVWGLNASGHDNLNSFLLENSLKLAQAVLYGRVEYVLKNAHELNLDGTREDGTYGVNALTLGVNKTILRRHLAFVSAGLQGTMNYTDKDLRSLYGKMPLSAEVYLRISPPEAHMH